MYCTHIIWRVLRQHLKEKSIIALWFQAFRMSGVSEKATGKLEVDFSMTYIRLDGIIALAIDGKES